MKIGLKSALFVPALGLSCSPAFAAPSADLTFLGIVASATPTVKVVMALLVLVSIASWSMLVRKLIELRRLERNIDHAEDRLHLAPRLDAIVEVEDLTVIALVEAAQQEASRSADLVGAGMIDGISARVALLLSRIEDAAVRRVSQGVGLFATAASVTPFVGLFGTVWGIMHSFIGIAQSNSTSLAVVAPGIAEALLATAIGLGVAIPATVMYNLVGKRVTQYRARLADCTARIACLVSRDAERAQIRSQASTVRQLKETERA